MTVLRGVPSAHNYSYGPDGALLHVTSKPQAAAMAVTADTQLGAVLDYVCRRKFDLPRRLVFDSPVAARRWLLLQSSGGRPIGA